MNQLISEPEPLPENKINLHNSFICKHFTLIELPAVSNVEPLVAMPGVVLKRTALQTKTRVARFTLIELLVVIAIISILMAMLLPALSKARNLVKTSVCLGNEKQMGTAMMIYVDENQNLLPSLTNPPAAWGYKNYIRQISTNTWTGIGLLESAAMITSAVRTCPGRTKHFSSSGNDVWGEYAIKWSGGSNSGASPQFSKYVEKLFHGAFGPWLSVTGSRVLLADACQPEYTTYFNDWLLSPELPHGSGAANILLVDGSAKTIPRGFIETAPYTCNGNLVGPQNLRPWSDDFYDWWTYAENMARK